MIFKYFKDKYYLDNWEKWASAQSEDVRGITAHMTRDEKKTLLRMASAYGGIMGTAIGFAIPIGFFLLMTYPLLCILFAVACIAFFAASTRYIRRYQRELLCSSEWAREQGYRPDSIQLFRK